MTLKQFCDSLTPEQKTYFLNYVQNQQDKLYEHGYEAGTRNGLYKARDLINKEFGL